MTLTELKRAAAHFDLSVLKIAGSWYLAQANEHGGYRTIKILSDVEEDK